MSHSPEFLKLVDDAKTRVKEVTIEAVRAKQARGDRFVLVDVREDSEWDQSRIPGSQHIGRGVLERDIESRIPDKDAEIVLYCGGGFRSALAADMIQRMGYRNVASMDGGIRAWREKGYPLEE